MSKQHYSEVTSMNHTLQPCDANNLLGEHTAERHPLFHDCRLGIQNAHHPKHNIDIDLCPDLDEIDGLRHCHASHHHFDDVTHHLVDPLFHDCRLGIQNAHHPKHNIDIDLCPDLDEIDGLRHCHASHHHFDHATHHHAEIVDPAARNRRTDQRVELQQQR